MAARVGLPRARCDRATPSRRHHHLPEDLQTIAHAFRGPERASAHVNGCAAGA